MPNADWYQRWSEEWYRHGAIIIKSRTHLTRYLVRLLSFIDSFRRKLSRYRYFSLDPILRYFSFRGHVRT